MNAYKSVELKLISKTNILMQIFLKLFSNAAEDILFVQYIAVPLFIDYEKFAIFDFFLKISSKYSMTYLKCAKMKCYHKTNTNISILSMIL
jgi:hypothetical protein